MDTPEAEGAHDIAPEAETATAPEPTPAAVPDAEESVLETADNDQRVHQESDPRIEAEDAPAEPTGLPGGVVGASYHQQVIPDALHSSNAMPPILFSIAGGALPPGLILGAGGLITGTPTASGDFVVEVQAHDVNNTPFAEAYRILVDAQAEPEVQA